MPTHPSAQPPPAWPGAPRRRATRLWLAVLLLVAALHLLLLQLAQRALHVAPRAAAQHSATVLVLLPPAVAPRKALPLPPPDEPRRALRRWPKPVPQPRPEAPRRVVVTPAASAASAAVSQAALPPALDHAAPTPAAAGAGGSLLDSEATRQAVREAARKPSLAELGAQASGESAPLSEQQRLGREIARGAIGDCLKGEYAGSGMGLLSLPFWLMAELRDKCRR